MTAETQRLAPLRGPVGPRRLLCMPSSDPVQRLRRAKVHGFLISLVGVALVGVASWYTLRELIPSGAIVTLWVLAGFTFFIGETLFAIAGSSVVRREIRSWRDLNRFPEIAITLLRPVTVGQLIITPLLRPIVLLVVGGYVVFVFALLSHQPQAADLLIPFGLIAAHLVITLHLFAWIQLCHSLGAPSPARAIVSTVSLGVICLAALAPFIWLVALSCVAGWNFAPPGVEISVPIVHTALVVSSALLIMLKLLLARAHAVHFERAVFPRLTF